MIYAPRTPRAALCSLRALGAALAHALVRIITHLGGLVGGHVTLIEADWRQYSFRGLIMSHKRVEKGMRLGCP